MRGLLTALAGVVLGTCLLHSGAQADAKVRIGFPVQIHTANMMVLQEHAKKHGVELDVAVMRGYPSIQLALMTDQLDLAVGSRRRRDGDVFVHRDGQDQSFVVIGVIAQHLEPARRPCDVRRRIAELFLE